MEGGWNSIQPRECSNFSPTSKYEQLARKKKVRGGHRASATQILGQIEPAITAEPLDVSKINQLKRSLEDKLQSLSDLDQAILDLTP